ncbi:MAG: RNA-directed DNA polymerase [Verrucomicrobiota bacterium]|jgi:hypothetical protein
MDHQRAINRLRTRELLSAALDYAIFDRRSADYFYDPLEIEHAVANRATIITELVEELQTPAHYSPRPAFAYFPPKSDLCDRRMTYIPIKDLTVRYGIAILFAEQIETEIHPHCFANRRAGEADAARRFTEDFSTGGWARFCQWQAESCNTNNILLRTDISAFYDSISHDYLIDAVCRHLSLPQECDLIVLLRRLLEVPIRYYSPSTHNIETPAVLRQGLPIGDGVEGYLANIYLKDLDDAMIGPGASYGRYVDDIRLFGTSREAVLRNLGILQEQLLRKGLNLNSSKTKIAVDEASRGDLLSRAYEGGDYGQDEDEVAGSEIATRIDAPFEAFSRRFAEDQELQEAGDAKDFCKFLGAHDADGLPLVALGDRQIWHVERLRDIMIHWRGPARHAGWLLVQTALYGGVPAQARDRARQVILELLASNTLNAYSRYRILHHLAKLRACRTGQPFRFILQLTDTERQQIEALLPQFLAAPAFELNLIALYTYRVLGRTTAQLRTLVSQHCRQGCEPVRNALAAASAIPTTAPAPAADAAEPDAISEPY